VDDASQRPERTLLIQRGRVVYTREWGPGGAIAPSANGPAMALQLSRLLRQLPRARSLANLSRESRVSPAYPPLAFRGFCARERNVPTLITRAFRGLLCML